MAWSYTGTPYTGRNKVRSLIGDTDINDQQITDHEIDSYLSIWSNETEAAAHICRNLAAKYAVEGNIRVDGYQIENLKKAEFFAKRAKDLFLEAFGSERPIALASPLFGGISVSSKNVNTANTDNVLPRFYRGQFSDLSESARRDTSDDE